MKKKITILWSSAAILLVFILFPMLVPQEKIGITNENGMFTVFHGTTTALNTETDRSCSFAAEEIVDVLLLEEYEPGVMKDGIETKTCLAGEWIQKEAGLCQLFVYRNVNRAVQIRTASGTTIIMNLQSEEMTGSFYEALMKLKKTADSETAGEGQVAG